MSDKEKNFNAMRCTREIVAFLADFCEKQTAFLEDCMTFIGRLRLHQSGLMDLVKTHPHLCDSYSEFVDALESADAHSQLALNIFKIEGYHREAISILNHIKNEEQENE